MAIEKIKILGAVLELPAKQHYRFEFGQHYEYDVSKLITNCLLTQNLVIVEDLFT